MNGDNKIIKSIKTFLDQEIDGVKIGDHLSNALKDASEHFPKDHDEFVRATALGAVLVACEMDGHIGPSQKTILENGKGILLNFAGALNLAFMQEQNEATKKLRKHGGTIGNKIVRAFERTVLDTIYQENAVSSPAR